MARSLALRWKILSIPSSYEPPRNINTQVSCIWSHSKLKIFQYEMHMITGNAKGVCLKEEFLITSAIPLVCDKRTEN